jgi:predicted metallopeptidase
MIHYERSLKLEGQIIAITRKLSLTHIDLSRVVGIRSRGSKSRHTLARCHVLSRIMQKALGTKAHYVIEIISENFDRLSEEEQIKTIIHELLHIPKSFKGGFRHHRPYVNKRTVDIMYTLYVKATNGTNL